MKKWLTEKYLPLWAKETVLRDNRQLRAENRALMERIGQLEHYIRGLHKGLRGTRRQE